MSELRLGADSNIRLDGGISYKYTESQLNDNQSPFLQNVNADDRGSITKRKGQKWTYDTTLGSGGISGAFGRLYKGQKVISWGTGLYTQSGSSQPVQIFSGLSNSKGTFFAFGGLLYYINGTDFVQWNGAAAQRVSGYVPTLTISRPPSGGGSSYEAFNMLTPSFKDSFSADGAATAYQLSLSGLDATSITATVNGVTKTEGVDFTVNRTTGVVTFTSAPATGTNNVIIQAAKTISGYSTRVLKCRYAIDYGGENDTRMFLSGNPDYPNRIYRSGLVDASYWPDNTFQNVGTDFEAITGFAKQGEKLAIFKERSLFFCVYTNEGGTITFPTYPINSTVGCDMPGTIQIIDNNPVFGNTETGLYVLLRTSVKDESVVRPISGNINGTTLRNGLLDLPKSDLQNASSADAEGKYWLCVRNIAYVWDYKLGPFVNTGNLALDEERLPWFYYTNINASCWVQADQELYYGDRSTGNLVEFQDNYNDFGEPIESVWRSKLFNFGIPDYLKTITEVWFSTRSGSYSTVKIKFSDDNGVIENNNRSFSWDKFRWDEMTHDVDITGNFTIPTSSFSWSRFSWNIFRWNVYTFPQTIKMKPKIKKVVHFQIEFKNDGTNENMSLLSLIIRYMLIRKVK